MINQKTGLAIEEGKKLNKNKKQICFKLKNTAYDGYAAFLLR